MCNYWMEEYMSTCNLHKYCQSGFHRCYTNLCSPQQCMRWPVSLNPCQHSILSNILIFTKLIGKMMSLCGLVFHSEWGWLCFPVFKSHFYFFYCGKNFWFSLPIFLLACCPPAYSFASCIWAISLWSIIYVMNIFVQFWDFIWHYGDFCFAMQNFKNFCVVQFNRIQQSFYLCLHCLSYLKLISVLVHDADCQEKALDWESDPNS